MTPEEQLFGLVEAAEAQQKAAAALLVDLRAELRKLDVTGRSMAAAVAVAAGQAATQAIDASAVKLSAAALQLDQVGQRLGVKTFALVTAGCFAAVLSGFLALWLFTPGPGEILALRADKEVLEANLADLERRGARIKLETCGEKRRLCLAIDKASGSYAKPNGQQLAIPLGY